MAGGGSGKKWSDEEIAEVLEACKGNISEAARVLGYKGEHLRNRVNANPELCAIKEELKKQLIDRCASVIESKVESDDDHVALKAAIFVLRTQGRNDGWGDSTAISGSDGGTPTIIIKREGD